MLVEFGRFGRPHGVRGEVRFWPHNPASALLTAGRRIAVGPDPDRARSVEIDALRFDAKGAVVHLVGVDDRDAAAGLNHQRWFEPREAFPPLADDEVYACDLIGLTARRLDGQPIGRVIDVLNSGPHDLLVIDDGKREHLVPNVEAFVKRMDFDAREIVIEPIAGLLDEGDAE
ncbi:MAG: 16S rRNA processing protein RimM [Myxococcales bacterium]|nr:16S rRNA processing protein RimM [Myxococcales bacterium]